MDYKSTLLMPKTGFEMKANLNIKEPQIQQSWKTNKIYEKILNKNINHQQFILHDGPPYANGNLHIGHILNKTLKDFIVRYYSFKGYYTPFNPGWDTHGLPIELAMLKQNPNAKNLDIIERRNICKQYALDQVSKQLQQFERIGLLSNLETKYLTLNHEYVIKQLNTFKEMVKQNIVFQELKPVYWSWSSQTSLAEAEIEYGENESDSIYFSVSLLTGKYQGAELLIWTTTPWTLPANLAVAINPNFTYCLVKINDKKIILAKDLLQSVLSKLNISHYEIVDEFIGKELENQKYKHPIKNFDCPIILAEYVSNTDGTGLVHNAPGFGLEDYIACKQYNIKIYCPIDEYGKFTSDINDDELVNKFYIDTNPIIINRLINNNKLWKQEKITHNVGYDWRTKKPIMYRATKQWFINLKHIKNIAIESLKKDVKSPHQQNTDRMIDMISKRDEWCISRQRIWGVPLPIIYDQNNNPLLDVDLIANIISILDKKGINYWYQADVNEFLTPKYKNTNNKYTKEKDIMDVWFDSGCSHNMLEYWKFNYPADLYLEGSDQYRGWFNSSLIIGTILHQKAPYKAILQHGFVLDEKGFKMSKSKGNTVDPSVVFNKYGSDICRLWIANSEYTDDLRIGDNILNQTSEIYRKIRNSLFKYSLSIINDFNYELDKQVIKHDYNLYIMNKLYRILAKVDIYYKEYKFNDIIKTIYNFVLELSNWYFEFIKDYIYCYSQNDLTRREIQTVVYTILINLTIALSPIIPHTTEEVYSFLNKPNKLESVHLEDWFNLEFDPKIINFNYQKYEEFFKFRSEISTLLESIRNDGLIKKNNEAMIIINDEIYDKFSFIDLKTWLMVAAIKIDKNIQKYEAKNANFDKCLRCWGFFDNINNNLCSNCNKILNIDKAKNE